MENNQQEFCPNNNLAWAILSTVFCCLPLGIVSIVKSASVDRLWSEGRHEEARAAAKTAMDFAKWGAIVSAIVWFLYLLFVVILGVASY